MLKLNREKYRQSIIVMTERPISLLVISNLFQQVRGRLKDLEEIELINKVMKTTALQVKDENRIASKQDVMESIEGYLQELVSKTNDTFSKTVLSNILKYN
ncbi:hypothetical protein P9X10_01515 [Bacillus cereus]|nr:hypothetical protein [Bacillus cereus]